MDDLLTQLRAAAEPTRLRLLALCARHPLCVTDLCAVLGQSQSDVVAYQCVAAKGQMGPMTLTGAYGQKSFIKPGLLE